MIDQLLHTLHSLEEHEKHLLKTFEERINAIYPLQKHIPALINALRVLKEEPTAKADVLSSLNKIKEDVVPLFANLNTALSPDVWTQERTVLDQIARQRKHVYEKIAAVQARGGEHGEHAKKRLEEAIIPIREELAAIGKEEQLLEHIEQIKTIFRGMIHRHQKLIQELGDLIQQTEQFSTDPDRLMLEWQTMLKHMTDALREEKIHVYDKLQPLLHEAEWAEQLIDKYEAAHTITKEQVARDLSTITSPEEFMDYQTLIYGQFFELLEPDAREYLMQHGRQQSKQQKLGRLTSSHEIMYDDKTKYLLRPKAFEETVNVTIETAKRHDPWEPCGLIFFDIDNFGQFNKTYGEHVGDIVLQVVAKIIKESTRSADLLGRWGGEEMLVMTHPGTRNQETTALAEKLRERIASLSKDEADAVIRAQNIELPQELTPVTVSVGIAFLNEHINNTWVTDFPSLFRIADERMRISKQTGKNKVTQQGRLAA